MAEPKRKAPAARKKSEPASKKRHQEKLLDEALAETFPASDPVAMIEPGPNGKDSEGDDQ